MSSENPKSVGWQFVLQWTLATTISIVAITIGIIVLRYVEVWLVIIPIILSGLIIGYAQSLILRNYVGWFKRWKSACQLIIPYSMLRTVLIISLIGGIINVVEMYANYLSEARINLAIDEINKFIPLTQVLFAFLVSSDIRSSLKDKIIVSKWWIFANVVVWVFNPFFFVLSQLKMSEILTIILIALSIGVTIGIAQGIVLLYDLREHLRIAGLRVPETISEVI